MEMSNQNAVQEVEMETKQALGALAALAQETRLGIFRLLVQAGPNGMAASSIGERLEIAPSSLSFHLKELTHSGLIAPSPEGRFIIYRANFDAMNMLLAFLTENCCGGKPCLPGMIAERPLRAVESNTQ
jgi:ArsR family transcriptional regulator, arsenate/arsenite/antimonite-responsive transcriptional repressor